MKFTANAVFWVQRRTRNLGLERCRHQKKRERQHRLRGRTYTGCSLSNTDENRLKRKGCELYDHFSGAGFAYISFEEKALYLGLRKGRVQKHKRLGRNRVREPKDEGRRFILMSESFITSNRNLCRA
ncbi:hypothetical protein GWK47_041562 [Chionoecetes opilio]|uniref:Uncharacterized protein n=1 Tax=Chionoecetes opilio TaxID=41210 RepID=A0A8J5CZE3_CHIOP|nr:hypothetical protein GWK47_041562 [Chionoecetes opilio]